MKYSFIINPTANHGKAKQTWAMLQKYLNENNIEYINEVTRYPGDATEITQRWSQDVADSQSIVIAVGGDATVDEVINGLYNHNTYSRNTANRLPLAVIPAGQSNHFAKAYGIDANPVKAFQQIQAATATQKIYIGHYHESIKDEDGYFINTWGVGFDAALMSHRQSLGKNQHMHMISFLRNALAVLYNQQPFSLMLQENHHHTIFPNTFLATCFNHLIHSSPQQKHQELFAKELNLLVIERHNWFITFLLLLKMVLGNVQKSRWAHYYHSQHFHYTTTSLEFVQKDGIELGNRFIDVTIDSVPCNCWQQSTFSSENS
ncbi:diacylglycerol/lipid kinase family protein [Limosilactobacillus caecicola]|uniref:diacylglycerol/lipid kinase family protein n=1 Tax=Limosilactobacillus caecicola TaxID=2941332 RepID=UPI00204263C5|nr:diacylglycerol kinase family protein [Limosilactobacillus caecicola]